MRFNRTGVAVWCLLAATRALADVAADREKQAYCQHVLDVAKAQQVLDRGIEGFGRIGQSDTNPDLKQAVLGASKSLSRHLQGDAAVRAAALDCELYAHSLDVELIVNFRMLAIEQQVAARRVEELTKVLGLLDEEVRLAERRKQSGDATTAEVMALNQHRLQLHGQWLAAQRAAVGREIPELPTVDVGEALQEVDRLTLALQGELNRRQALQAWDVALVGGLQRPISGQVPGASPELKPFASLTFRYNFNDIVYRRQLDATATSALALRKAQNAELTRRLHYLRESVGRMLKVETAALPGLAEQRRSLAAEMERLRDIDSALARKAKSQLRVSLAVAAMEENLSRFKVGLLNY